METKDSLALDEFARLLGINLSNSNISSSVAMAAAVDAAKQLQLEIDRIKSNNDLKLQIEKELLKVDGRKQIHFANPEKLSGKIEHKGATYEIVYIGRDLSLAEDNFTWICRPIKNVLNEAQLTVFKNPIKDGEIKLHMKSIFETKPEASIKREFLNQPTWIRTKLLELADPALPF